RRDRDHGRPHAAVEAQSVRGHRAEEHRMDDAGRATRVADHARGLRSPEESMSMFRHVCIALAAVAFAATLPAHADDTLKIAAGQRGNWDTTIAEMGQRAGIFKRHGLTLEILWTQGGGETQQ